MSMRTTSVSAEPAISLMPDCCNAGVIGRVLGLTNLAVFVASMIAPSRSRGWSAFVESSALVDLLCMAALVTLCALRPYVTKLGAALQRLICVVVPTALTALALLGLLRLDWFALGFPNVSMFNGVLVTAVFAAVLQEYLQLRARAFSPALSEARLQALQARIRPHFLFNSLNAVLSLIRSEPRRAENALEDLADLFRVLMRDSRDLTSLEDEIRLCKQYLSIETIRLGERLRIEWDTSGIHAEALANAQIPSLLLQPLLENAVYYGVEQSSGTGLIRIVLRRSRDTIHIAITNPYHGDTSVSLGNHMALDNIRSRLKLLYDVEAEFSTAIVKDHFEVRMLIPYTKVPR